MEGIKMSHQEIIFNNKIFKQYLDTNYYASKDGDIYSGISKRIINPLKRTTRNKTYYYIDIKQKHTNVHRIVYIAWNGELQDGEIIRHINDDTTDNRLCNLQSGTQKDNITDCINNGHRVGGTYYLTLFDKKVNDTITFCPASDFIEYSGHPCGNKSVKRMFTRNWFKKRYEIVQYARIKNLDELKSVTTMSDECNSVG